MKIVTHKVNLNKSKLKKLERATVIALYKTGDALHSDVIQEQVIPFDTGNMQNNNTFVDDNDIKQGKIALTTVSPQARRLYFHPEYNFQTKENANAQGRWLDKWKSGSKKNFAKETFIKFYKKEAGLT